MHTVVQTAHTGPQNTKIPQGLFLHAKQVEQKARRISDSPWKIVHTELPYLKNDASPVRIEALIKVRELYDECIEINICK